MNNIDKFDILVGRILAKLYTQFPIKTVLDCEDFGIKNSMDEFLGEINSQKGEFSETEFFIATASWLCENGLITAKKVSYGYFDEAILTYKGLKTLKTVPKNVKDKENKNIGEHLSEYIKIARDEGIKNAVNIIFSLSSEFLK